MEQQSLDTEKVKAFFNQPQLYLKNEFGRNIRRDIIRRLLDGKRFERMVDIGCGDGSLSLDFLGKCQHITLADISDSMLALAEKRLGAGHGTELAFKEGNFVEMDFPFPKYDLVLCIGVLAHVANVEAALTKLFKLMDDKGRIALQFSDYRSWMTRLQMSIHRKTYQLKYITLPQILAICHKNGYELERKQQFSVFFPGIGKLPGGFTYWLQKTVYKSNLLSKLGSDYIIVLRKK